MPVPYLRAPRAKVGAAPRLAIDKPVRKTRKTKTPRRPEMGGGAFWFWTAGGITG